MSSSVASIQNLCTRLSIRDRFTQSLCIAVGDRYTRSLLPDPCTRYPKEISAQSLLKRSLYKVSKRDLCIRSLRSLKTRSLLQFPTWSPSKISARDVLGKIPARDLYARSLGKISLQAHYFKKWQDLCQRSLHKISPQSVYRRSFGKICAKDLSARFARKLALKNLLAKRSSHQDLKENLTRSS
jgi:hypothetical protein